MSLKTKYKLEFNFIIYLIGKVISAGVMIASIPLFIRYFGVKEYGDFILFYTTFLMLYAGSTGWVVQGILRFYTLESNKEKIRNEINQMILNSFVFSVIILLAVFTYYDADITLLIIAVCSLFFSLFYTSKITIEQALLKSKNYIIADIIRVLIFLTIPLSIKFILPSVSAINALFLGVLFSYLLSVLWLSKFKITFPSIRFRGKTRWRKIFLKYGLPLSLWMMFSPTTNGVDRYIIEYSLGTIMLAKYTAVFDIVFKVFSSIAIPFNNIVQPMLIQNYNEKNYTEYKKTVNKALVYLTLIFLLFISGVILLQDFIICRYLGFCEQSLLLSKLIIPLAFSSYIWQIAILLQKNMEVSNKTFEITIYMLIVVVIIVLLGIIFVPSYGLLASAYISLFTASVYLLLVIYGTKKHFKL
ncbi:hypothetical protein [Litoribaculum gwangyangense]|uniref:Polysaccharide biosynthesis protein C-terminal domain-containing protein n=1 Tax=Litoribaculum gwangyangense TaxID=1130722 RepID=A0ABP9BYK1_9FLAO